MKIYMVNSAAVLAAIAAVAVHSPITLRAADTNGAPERIGVYDSRVVAYAHFSSESNLAKIKQAVKAAKEVEATGQTERIAELKAGFKKGQEQVHLQVFGTARWTTSWPNSRTVCLQSRRKPAFPR